jgi:hypothetical protein
MNTFAVTNPKLLRKGALIGSVDIDTPWGLKVIGGMLFEKEGKRWVNFPSKEWTKQDGTRGFFPLLEWTSPEARQRFQRAVLPLAEESLLGHPARAQHPRGEPKSPREMGMQLEPPAFDDSIPF